MEQWMNNWGTALRNFAYKMTQNCSDANDAVQEELAKLWQHRKRDHTEIAKGYTYRVPLNTMPRIPILRILRILRLLRARAKSGSSGRRPLGRLAEFFFRALGFNVAFYRFQGRMADTPGIIGTVPELRFPIEFRQMIDKSVAHAARTGGFEIIDFLLATRKNAAISCTRTPVHTTH